jgi:hypothetical protein
MNNYEKHAWIEFRAAGWVDENNNFKDDMQEMICKHVLKLLNVFNGEGHSGSSAPYALDLFQKLAKFEPVAPLTGEDFEWNEVNEGSYQNNRCSHVFKDKNRFNGQAYDIEAKVFWEWCGTKDEQYKSYYTCGESHQPITFPYVPKIEYVYRKSEAESVSPEQTEEGIL